MIRHICMFTMKEENKKAHITEFIKRAESLRAIENIKNFLVVRNADRTPASNYDVALIFDFDSVESLEVYQNSEIHKEFGRFVGTVREQRACIDYEF